MASVTLAESAKLSLDQLAIGVIENIITVNPIFDVLPFEGIEGNSLAYNREATLGDVQTAGVNTTITAKAAATFTKVNSNLTTIIGDAEINGLIQATRSNKQDQAAIQIASKAKSCARSYQDQMVNGDGTGNDFEGIASLCPAGQTVVSTTNGDNLTFEVMDELIDLVTDKDGQVDYFMMNSREIRAFNALLRTLGGAAVNEVLELPSGRTVPHYRGIPIFRNDWIPVDETQGSSSNASTIYAGTLDDGSMSHGIAGLTASQEAGIVIEDVGVSETADNRIWRVKWYASLALFSERGIACATGIIP